MMDSGLWQEFDAVVGDLPDPPPKPDISKETVIRQRLVTERVAGWFLSGRLPLLVVLLAYFGLAFQGAQLFSVPVAVTLFAAYLLFTSVLGARPSSNLWRLGLTAGFATMGCAITVPVWNWFSLFGRKSEGIAGTSEPHTEELASRVQDALQQLTTWNLFLPLLVVALLSLLAVYFCRRKFYWLPTDYRVWKWRSALSVFVLTLPIAGFLGLTLFFYFSTRSLGWVSAAEGKSLKRQPSLLQETREYHLKDPFIDSVLSHSMGAGRIDAWVRNLSDQQILRLAASLREQILAADYRPTRADNFLLETVVRNLNYVKEPSAEAAFFNLAHRRLCLNDNMSFSTLWFHNVVRRHQVPLMLKASKHELNEWENLARLSAVKIEQRDIDAQVLYTLRLHENGAANEKPLRLFGVVVSPSLRYYLARWESMALLYDYNARRPQMAQAGSPEVNFEVKKPPSTPWFEGPIQSIYFSVEVNLADRSDAHYNDLMALVIKLRRHRLKTGSYPATLPPAEYSYSLANEDGQLYLLAVEQRGDSLGGKWRLP